MPLLVSGFILIIVALVGSFIKFIAGLKCHRLFRPKISKVKTSFVFEIRRVSNILTPNEVVSGDTRV